MERFRIIENKSGKYPIYYLIDSVMGYQVKESINKKVIEKDKADLNEYHQYI